MSRLRKEATGFTQIKNDVLCDPQLSLKAKGLYAYLFSKPDGWQFSGDRMASETNDGRKSIYACLSELEKRGLLVRNKLKTGRIDYLLKHSKGSDPDAQKGQEGIKAYSPKGQPAETGSVSNTDSIQSNTDSILAADAAGIRDVIESFRKAGDRAAW